MSFDQPREQVPTPEREPHFPTFENINEQLKRLTGRDTFKEERRVNEGETVKLYEVSFVGEDGITCLYTYRKADGIKIPETGIDVAYCNGSPDDNDFLPGGYNVSRYDPLTAEWSDTVVIQKTGAPESPAPAEMRPEQALIKNDAVSIPDSASVQEVSNALLDKERLASLQEHLDAAEAAYSNIDPNETNPDIVKEARAIVSPLIAKILDMLVVLNKSESQLKNNIHWNPHGSLTEQQFSELDLRRKRISKIYGSKQKDASGKIIINHD